MQLLDHMTVTCRLLFSGKLDQVWVLEWLGDIGLPRYKPTFAANLIDGRLLNALTYVSVVM